MRAPLKTLLSLFVLLTFQVSLAASWQLLPDYGHLSAGSPSMVVNTTPTEFKIMSYNVLNLFDSEHDRGKLDHTFLPLNYPDKAIHCQRLRNKYYREECLTTNWTNKKVLLKLHQIKKVIAEQGSLPDLLALQEIENENVIQMLGQVLGYSHYVVTNSPDKRGIDVALLFNQKKLEYIEHQEIDISSHVGFETRNILRVHFRPKRGHGRNSRVIGVYVNHWPSQAAGSISRYTAAQVLANTITQQTEAIGVENYYVIATGDFNTIDRDSPHPFHDMLSSPFQWNNFLYDTHQLSKDAGNPMQYFMPPGTYWYGREGAYNRLDRFFISQNLRSDEGITLVPTSYRIVGTQLNSRMHKYRRRSPDFYPEDQFVPIGYNFDTTNENELGFSDHYPIVVKFKMK